MTTTVLQIAIDVADELSLNRPKNVFEANIDSATAQKLARHITRTCKRLAGRFDWQVLQKEHTFTTTNTEVQAGAIPPDFKRLIAETAWNRSKRRKFCDPITGQHWQDIKANVSGGVQDLFRIRGNDFLIYPKPNVGETIAFEYISTQIGTDKLSAALNAFSADTDTIIFNDELIILGAVWRYRKAEGLDYSEEYREFEQLLYDLMKSDGGSRRFDMNGTTTGRQITPKFKDFA